MSTPKYTYSVEVEHGDGWFAIVTGERHGFALGYFLGRRTLPPPRLSARLMRSDGREMDVDEAVNSVAIGMVAGFPTPDQYERAAAEALETAARIRADAATRAARRKS